MYWKKALEEPLFHNTGATFEKKLFFQRNRELAEYPISNLHQYIFFPVISSFFNLHEDFFM